MPTVLVTGANRGLGLEFARQYGQDGWRVIATARNPAKARELKATGAEIHALEGTDSDAVRGLGKTLGKESIDVLIANAGLGGDWDRFDAERWVGTFRVNAIAPFALAGAFRKQVARSGERKMIAITSGLGSIAGTDGGYYGYRASKAALNMLWRSLASDWEDVIAVLLSPGWVKTDMGGSGAPLSPEDSITAMRRVIARLKPADSGKFLGHDGRSIPW